MSPPVGVTITVLSSGQAPTAITLSASPLNVSAGAPVSFSGALTRTDTGAALSAHTVHVETSADAGATWTTAGSFVTNFPDGGFSGIVSFPSAGNYLIRSNFPGGSDGVTTFGPSTSSPIGVVVGGGGGGGGPVGTATTFSATPTSINTGQNLSFSGTLTRTDTGAGLPGQTIIIESSSNNGSTWSASMTTTTGSGGSYSGSGSFTTAGTYLMRGRFAGA